MIDRWLDHWWGFALVLIRIVLAIFVVVGAGLSLVAIPISKHYDSAACHSFGKQTNREVKFVTYTYWSWDCLTPTTDGKWISTDKLWQQAPVEQ